MRGRTLPHSRLGSRGGNTRRTARRTVVLAVTAAMGAGLLAGCADDGGSDSSSSGDNKGKTVVKLGLFGAFGYKEAGLYAEYEKLNPKIKIEETVTQRNENYYPALVNHLTTGAGLMDIQAVEVGNINEVVNTQADKLEDVSKAPGVKSSEWLDWKWQQATTKDGQTIGLGTDVGPVAICYRKDLFKEAGLPTDREELAKRWAGDWKKLIDVGEEYQKNAPEGTTFMDSPGGLMSAILGSEKVRFYDESGEVIYKSNPVVKESFMMTAKAAEDGLVGSLAQFQPDWNTSIANSKFAAIACPPWMLGTLKEHSKPESKGKWDVAVAPKSGNWGGAFLSVPKAGKNTKEALKLAAWLTAPEQQAKLFKVQGNFPSAPGAYTTPEVTGATNEMTGDAPVGTIFAEAAKTTPVQVIGPKDQIIGSSLNDNGLVLVTKGKSPADAWETATKTIDNKLEK
ncbi:ABC transporter substrate-binding protein [Streptomyces spongiae]|uniref:Extracellular solute-binding protein n=1 Tax=Streptomyces spongiae TaxID=565072 RepID=A0A5N8Y046_9ACTN|nr:extracellular solute-binding protein [Streptomyces spongiae]MPY64936.1 extracellular solute-binding protein [Streptomyces spongiae]